MYAVVTKGNTVRQYILPYSGFLVTVGVDHWKRLRRHVRAQPHDKQAGRALAYRDKYGYAQRKDAK